MSFKQKSFRVSFPKVLFFIGILLLSILFYVTWIKCYNPFIRHKLFRGNYLLALLYFMLLLMTSVIMNGHKLGETRIQELIVAQILALFMTTVIIYFPTSLLQYNFLRISPLLTLIAVQLVVIVLWNWIAKSLYVKLIPPLKTLLLWDSKRSIKIAEKITGQTSLYDIRGRFFADADHLNLFEEEVTHYDAVLMCIEDGGLQDAFTYICFKKNVQMFMVPTLMDIIVNSSSGIYVSDTPIIQSSSHKLTIGQLLWKRMLDIGVSLIAIVITSPIWLATAIAIKLCDHGPVFFRQERLTRFGHVFSIYKFRSMYTDAEADGQRLATEGDNRITPVGRVIRKFRIDELPQFLNVLKGEMSVIGPRPEVPSIAAKYTETYPAFPFRLKVKAGITGLAQVYGNYATHPEDKLLMDLIYIEHYSFVRDVSILLMTVKALFITEKTQGVGSEASSLLQAGTDSKEEA